jgi:hypothetical protein
VSLFGPETSASTRADIAHSPLILHYHLFKNAGTSVDVMLERNFGDRWMEAEFRNPVQSESNAPEVSAFLASRPGLLAFSSHTAVLPTPSMAGRSIFPILFVRHPIDRLKSAYNFERIQNADTGGARLARATDFAGYLKVLTQNTQNRQAQNFQTYRLAFNFPPESGSELERAQRALSTLPFVGLVEAYDRSLEHLQALLQPLFPGFQAFSVKRNVTVREARTLEGKLNAIREEIGDELYEAAEQANSDDLAIFAQVKTRMESNG